MAKCDKRVTNAWSFYDWANSVYNLVITAAVFPAFYTAQCPEQVQFYGGTFEKIELYTYVLAASYLVIVCISPILSGIADYTGNKKIFLQIFCYIGVISCASLYFFDPENLELSMLSPFFASIGFWGSFVFYNAYLPEIAEPEDHDRISARGYIMGYIGSSILLIVCLAMILGGGEENSGINTRYSFVLVALWWAGFAQITFRRLPKAKTRHKVEYRKLLSKGFHELALVSKDILRTRRLWIYLLAFFFFNMGVQIIMQIASAFGTDEIGLKTQHLIIAILLMQFLGATGAFVMSRVSRVIGNIRTLQLTVFLWIVICVLAFFTTGEFMFYCLAAAVGFIMGGIQAQARSTYSKFLPETDDHASYFSFYDVLEKLGLSIGMFSFGALIGWYGEMRTPILMLIGVFVVGFVVLTMVPGKVRAKN